MSDKPRLLAIEILDRVFRSDSFADIVLENALKSSDLSGQDKAFISDIVYGALRWHGQLEYILTKAYRSDWEKIPPVVRYCMITGLYQLMHMDKVPDHAAVNESVTIAVARKGMIWGRVVNGVLREIIRNEKIRQFSELDDDPVKKMAMQWSHPEWLVKYWFKTLGDERTLALCQANNQRPTLHLRVNTMMASRERIFEELEKEGHDVALSPHLDEFLILSKGGGIQNSDLFKQGYFTIQDTSAGLVSHLMNPQPGDVILDMASAPGGKSSHMAELTRDQITLLAADRHPGRIGRVVKTVSRLRLNHVYPLVADGRVSPVNHVDKVLVDAPCSGLGVIQRRGELRWKRKPDQIPVRVNLQRALLHAAANCVKPGGILVYSTCSVLPDENWKIVDDFLENHPEFMVDSADQFLPEMVVSSRGFMETWPDLHATDGAFAARLKKVEEK